MINYIIQVILFQALFVAVYDFFLSKETFFAKNRWYLLSTALISFILPLLKIPTIQKAVPLEYTILLPEVVLSPQKVIEQATWYQSIDYLDLLFWLGSLLFLLVFMIKLQRIIRLIFKYGSENRRTYKLVLLPKNSKAFSFFNYIFLGREIPTEKQEKIIQHELVHSQQKHTFDLLFFEFLRIAMWFNPMVYVYQNRISLVHEYISDAIVSKSTPKESYINNLLSDIFQVESISFINQFYKHSLIKKRIIMMTKKKSKEIKQLKYLLLIPLLASMVLYTACSNEEAKLKSISSKQPVTVYRTVDGKTLPTSSSGYQSKYLDLHLGTETPTTKELTINDLTDEEREEFLELKEGFESKKSPLCIKVYEGFNNRKMVVFDVVKLDVKEDGEYAPFATLDKHPTFPGCEDGNKKCFSQSMTKFIQENFDGKLANTLGLEPGKKRIYVQFRIDKEGKVIDIKARAPHPSLKEHAMEVASKLPIMKPGEKDGKVVKTGYTLPITFNVK